MTLLTKVDLTNMQCVCVHSGTSIMGNVEKRQSSCCSSADLDVKTRVSTRISNNFMCTFLKEKHACIVQIFCFAKLFQEPRIPRKETYNNEDLIITV